MVRFAARQWSRYHALMHGAATDDGKLTIHLLQPNPHVPGTKVLTEDEERVIRDGLRFRDWVLTGYPLLQEELGELVQRGVVAEDLTRIFSDIEEDIWIDGAHPNSRGSRLIMDRAIDLIEAHPAGQAGRAPTRP